MVSVLFFSALMNIFQLNEIVLASLSGELLARLFFANFRSKFNGDGNSEVD